MLVLANNITSRNGKINQTLRRLKASGWKADKASAAVFQNLARQCVEAGADVLDVNIQQHNYRPEAMAFAVRAIQEVTSRQLCLSSDNAEALAAGLKACKQPPIVNYVSIDAAKLAETLPLAAKYNAEVVLLLTDPTIPDDAQEMLRRAAALLGATNEKGIPNSRLFIDPGLFHITSDIGVRHFVNVIEFLRALPEAFDPPVRSVCWIGNISAGVPSRLRPALDSAALAMLSGVGLASASLDVLRRENRRMVRLVKILKNEAIYADRDIEL
ncbi:MAG: dihydropteroate synthase [Chloroflexi bacterium]|nr:dihydropteroate synthase [Chloroflexota bacterium]